MKMIECIRKILDWKKDFRTVAAFLSGSSFVKRRVIHIIRHPCNPQFSSLRERSWAVQLTSILGGQSQNHIVEENRIKLHIYWCLLFLCSTVFSVGENKDGGSISSCTTWYFNLKGVWKVNYCNKMSCSSIFLIYFHKTGHTETRWLQGTI